MLPADVYDREFFRHYGAANADYARACRTVADELWRRFAPASAVDWGCGAALHARALADRGVRVIAVDAVRVDDDLRAEDMLVVLADLRAPAAPAQVPDSYDLSLCIDVLEHLEPEHADAALANITHGAGTLILSCAPPHQGGHDHKNEQPRRYWIEKLRALGWHYDRGETGALERTLAGRREDVPLSWMYHNLCVYRRYPTTGRRLSKRLRRTSVG